MMRTSCLLALLSACAHLQPSSLPATMPVGYVSVAPAEPAPADGFFISTPDLRARVKAEHLFVLDLQQQIAVANRERDDDAAALMRANWWGKYGVWLGAGLGALLGGFVGFEVGHR